MLTHDAFRSGFCYRLLANGLLLKINRKIRWGPENHAFFKASIFLKR